MDRGSSLFPRPRNISVGIFLLSLVLFYSSWVSSKYGLVKFGLLLAYSIHLAYAGVGIGRWWWFILALLVSTFSGLDWQVGLLGMYNDHENGLIGWLVCLLVMGAGGKDVGLWVLRAGVLSALWGYLQFMGWVGPVGEVLPNGRVYSTLGSPVFFGAWMGMCVPLAVGMRRWGSLVVVLSGLVMSGSRGGVLGALSGLIVLVCQRSSTVEQAPCKGKNRVRYLALALLLTAVAFGMWRSGEKIHSDRGRWVVWQAAWNGWKERPLLGWGPETYYLVAHYHRTSEWNDVYANRSQGNAHNLILEMLCTTGIAGLLALGWCSWREGGPVLDGVALAGAVAGFVPIMFNPISLAVKCGVMALFGAAMGIKRAAGRFERVALLLLLSVGAVGWARYAAWDRLAGNGSLDIWAKSQLNAGLNLRIIFPVAPILMDTGGNGER